MESADLVLCDISILNPNVFFELGIRTALNKLVCYVKDDITGRIPFDTGIINHHTYTANIASWNLDQTHQEVDSLHNHILESIGGNKGENSLWKYFGLTTAERPEHGTGSFDDRIDLLTMKVDSLAGEMLDQKESYDTKVKSWNEIIPKKWLGFENELSHKYEDILFVINT